MRQFPSTLKFRRVSEPEIKQIGKMDLIFSKLYVFLQQAKENGHFKAQKKV